MVVLLKMTLVGYGKHGNVSRFHSKDNNYDLGGK